MKKYTKNVGRKFNKNGSFRFFEGNTIICKVKPDCSFYHIAKDISEKIQSLNSAKIYTFLPFDSFHTTLIQGVCDEDRTKELWTSFFPLDAPLCKIDNFFKEQFEKSKPFPKVRLVFNYIDTAKNIIIIKLKPETEKDKMLLEEHRNHLASLIGICFPDHKTYEFHLSLAYQIYENDNNVELTDFIKILNEQYSKNPPSFTLPAPSMTYFKNMAHFSDEIIER